MQTNQTNANEPQTNTNRSEANADEQVHKSEVQQLFPSPAGYPDQMQNKSAFPEKKAQKERKGVSGCAHQSDLPT